VTCTALLKIFHEPQFLETKSREDLSTGLTEIDYEEQTAGYQAAYTRLVSSEHASVDPVAYVQHPQKYLGQELVTANNSTHGRITGLMQAGDMSVVDPFMQSLHAAGYVM
jgi:exportin-2 (importin alpha re-exporter)